jgi:hypothetical protein
MLYCSVVQREGLEALASRLSSTLGVGRLSNVAIEPILGRFMIKCIEFALALEDANEENPGERLGFLSLASK